MLLEEMFKNPKGVEYTTNMHGQSCVLIPVKKIKKIEKDLEKLKQYRKLFKKIISQEDKSLEYCTQELEDYYNLIENGRCISKEDFPEDCERIWTYLKNSKNITCKRPEVEKLYHDFCESNYFAGWLTLSEEILKEFTMWVNDKDGK